MSQLRTGQALCAELSHLAGLLVPLAGARVSAAFAKAVQTMFAGYTQVRAVLLLCTTHIRLKGSTTLLPQWIGAFKATECVCAHDQCLPPAACWMS